MSVIRDGNVCKITFEDDSWKEAEPDVFIVTDGAVPFYSADTWLSDEKMTLRSGIIGDGGTSETTITVIFSEAGAVSLNCAVSSEGNYDELHVFIDEDEKITISGTKDFAEYEFDVAAGTHAIVFRYTKDGSNSKGKDAAAIGYIQFTGVETPYEKRYLMTDFENKVYTVMDGEVQEIPSLQRTDLTTKAVFQNYGAAKTPTPEQLASLTRPVLYRWCEGDVKSLHGVASAKPKAQIICAVADMTHETIKGILSITSVYSGNVTVSYSYDDTAYTDPVLMSEFLQTEANSLYDGAENKMIYFRFVLEDVTASLTNFVISYKNE